MRILLAATLCIALTAAAAQPQSEPAPLQRMAPGQRAMCSSRNGCVAMDAEVFRQILLEAARRGAKACADST